MYKTEGQFDRYRDKHSVQLIRSIRNRHEDIMTLRVVKVVFDTTHVNFQLLPTCAGMSFKTICALTKVSVMALTTSAAILTRVW